MKKNACQKHLKWLLLGVFLTALTLIFPVIGFLQWFTMIPLFIGVYRLFEENCSLSRAYRYGFLTVYVYYVAIYHWIVRLYPLDFAGLDELSSIVVVLAGWLGLPFLQAVLGGFVFLLYAAIKKSGVFSHAPLLRPFVFACLWIIFEISSTYGWTGVPWGRLALGQINCLPMLQSASLFGSYFVSWLILAVNGLIAYMILYRAKATVCGITAGALLVANLAFGLITRAISESTDASSVVVAVIQGNINSHDKWGYDSYQKTRDTYGELTRKAAKEGAELVLWPETAFPSTLRPTSTNGKFLSALAQECNVTIVVGAVYTDEEKNDYNALFMIEPDGSFRDEFYAKRHLVPFGEYTPELMTTLIPPLGELTLGGAMVEGTDTALFDSKWGKIGSLICFDSIYEQLTIDSVRDGAEFFLLSSNDSWFYDSAAVYQHQAQAQLRAIESGREIVRSANTGISSVIGAKGDIKGWIDPLESGYAVAEITPHTHTTLYMAIGNLFVWLCVAFVVILLFFKQLERVFLKMITRAKKQTATE